jgi:hypothetical protein
MARAAPLVTVTKRATNFSTNALISPPNCVAVATRTHVSGARIAPDANFSLVGFSYFVGAASPAK